MREIFFITRIPPVHSFSTLSSYLKIHVDISISKILSILYLFGSGSINQKLMLIRKSRALFSRFYKNKKLIANIVNAILSHPKRYRAILATFITFPKTFFSHFLKTFSFYLKKYFLHCY